VETSASFEARYAPLSYPTEGGDLGRAMVDLNGHEAGNGGYSQGKPTAYRDSSTRRDAWLQQLPGRGILNGLLTRPLSLGS